MVTFFHTICVLSRYFDMAFFNKNFCIVAGYTHEEVGDQVLQL